MSKLRKGPWHRLPGVAVAPQERVYNWLRLCRVYERHTTTRPRWFRRWFDPYEDPPPPTFALRSVHDLVALAQSTLWEPLLGKLPEEVQRMVHQAYVVGTEEVAFHWLERNHYASPRMWEQIPRGCRRMWEGFLQEMEHQGTKLEEEQRKAVYASLLTPSKRNDDRLFRRHILCDEWRRRETLFHLLRGIRRMRPSPWADRALLDPFGLEWQCHNLGRPLLSAGLVDLSPASPAAPSPWTDQRLLNVRR